MMCLPETPLEQKHDPTLDMARWTDMQIRLLQHWSKPNNTMVSWSSDGCSSPILKNVLNIWMTKHPMTKHPMTKHWNVKSLALRFFFLIFFSKIFFLGGFPWGSAGKESTCNAGDLGSIPGLGRSLGKRKSYPFQYSGLENSMDCIVHGVAKSWTRLSNSFTFTLNPQGWFLNSLHHHLK